MKTSYMHRLENSTEHNNRTEIIPTLIHYSYLLLFFLTPLLISLKSTELFEFPKMLFVYVMTAFITGLWILDIGISGKLVWKRSWLDSIFGAVLLSQLVSSLYTMDRYTSFFGYYSRFHGGFWSILSYIILAWIFKNYGSKKWVQDVIISMLGSASLVSLYAIGEHFGIDAHVWVQDVQNRVFSTLGQPNWLGAWLGALLPFAYLWYLRPPKSFWPTVISLNAITVSIGYALTYLLTNNPLPVGGGDFLLFIIIYGTLNGLVMWKAKWLHERFAGLQRFNFLFLIILLQFAILFTKSRSGIMALAISTILFLLHEAFSNKKIKLLLPLLLTSCFLVLLIGTEWTPSLSKLLGKSNQVIKNPLVTTTNTLGITDSTDIRKVVWQGATTVWQNYPLFGSGTETFAYSYYNFRPKEHNLNSEWDFLYNKAHNEYLNLLANNGLVGTAAMLSIVVALVWLCLKYNTRTWTYLALFTMLFAGFGYLLSPHTIQTIINKLLIYPPLILPLGASLLGAVLLVFIAQRMHTNEQNDSNSGLESAVLASIVSIVITNFYGFSVVTVALIFFMLPVLLLLYQQEPLPRHELTIAKASSLDNPSVLSWIGGGVGLVLFGVVSIYTVNYYRADLAYNYSQSYLQAGDVLQADTQISTALRLHPANANYWLHKGLVDAQTAFMVNYKDASDSSGLVTHYTKSAVEFTQQALIQNPVHVNLYKSAARVYITLGLIDPTYTQFAIKTLELGSKLSPTDPQLPTNTALLYQQNGDYDKALQLYQKAIELKPDYGMARSLLAQMYEEKKDYQKAIEAYQELYEVIRPQDPRVASHVAELRKKITNTP